MRYLSIETVLKEITQNISEYVNIQLSEGRKHERLKQNKLVDNQLQLKKQLVEVYAPKKIERIVFIKKADCNRYLIKKYQEKIAKDFLIDGMDKFHYKRDNYTFLRGIGNKTFYAEISFLREEIN
jgi:hypothetical protein